MCCVIGTTSTQVCIWGRVAEKSELGGGWQRVDEV